MDEKKHPLEERDDSRPYFRRQKGEIGVYLMVYDAKPQEGKQYGLEHFFFMQLMESLYKEFRKMDVVQIRAALDKKDLLKGAYIERFEPGIIMAVGFDDADSLGSLWTSFKSGKLNAALQDALLTPSLMHSVEASTIVLHTRLFEDEFKKCHDEIYIQARKREDIQSMHSDMTMIARIKKYQKLLNQEVMSVRDLENQIEHSLGELMTVLKQIFPNTMTKLQSLQELETIIRDAQGTRFKPNGSLDLYINLIERMNKLYEELYISVSIPLLQIHSVCENDTQRKTKASIVEKIRDTSKLLRSDTDLQKVSHPGWSVKVIKREEGLFLGLISLVPISVEHAYDIDLLIDEYMRQFPGR
ncbi:hypothetical protein CHS0354_003902 [Potamilus streckersoni]|uniref:Uncharacterized protein n=1 Tax=Potamilus streckersoni TaxID=2493646 RepID=A0AAE0TFK0_9BIVA|nr:hypothetical protein CHS0354_003902 [Potamilus streckersoni]